MFSTKLVVLALHAENLAEGDIIYSDTGSDSERVRVRGERYCVYEGYIVGRVRDIC